MGLEIVTLRYGNTRTFLVRGITGCLLVDTDYAGTMKAFYRALKEHEIRLSDISLANDWVSILARNPRIIHYAHTPERPAVKS